MTGDYFDEDSAMFEDGIVDSAKQLKSILRNESNNQITKDPTQGGRAPTVAIEKFTAGKPLKVLSFLLTSVALILFTISLLSVTWMRTRGSRMGLFMECLFLHDKWVQENFVGDPHKVPGCYVNKCTSWEFWIIGIIATTGAGITLVSVVSLIIAMLSKYPTLKSVLYNLVILINIIAMTCQTIAVVMYPLFFVKKFVEESAVYSEGHKHGGQIRVGYCLIASAVGVVLLLLGTLLLALDKNSEEVFYREKIIHESEEEQE